MEPSKKFPSRKTVRLRNYDYSSPGSYFITTCIAGRKCLLWDDVGAATCRPQLSTVGTIVNTAILQISKQYPTVTVDNYCIMPDHIHMILTVNTDTNGRQIAAPTISEIVGHMKRWVSIQVGHSIWQKSFVDRVIRNEKGYLAVWEYIDNNPTKLDFAYDNIHFDEM